MANIQMVIDALQDAKVDEFNCIKITDEARCAMVRILMKEAERLKEQQPRVVTIDEIHNRDVECVWIEYDQNHYRTFAIEPGIFYATTTGNTTIFACGCGGMEFHDDEYNRAWRAWTARPSVEQRKTIPWED